MLILRLSRDNCFHLSAERRQSLGFDWHPTCLRCQECGKILNPGQHAEVPHFQRRLCLVLNFLYIFRKKNIFFPFFLTPPYLFFIFPCILLLFLRFLARHLFCPLIIFTYFYFLVVTCVSSCPFNLFPLLAINKILFLMFPPPIIHFGLFWPLSALLYVFLCPIFTMFFYYYFLTVLQYFVYNFSCFLTTVLLYTSTNLCHTATFRATLPSLDLSSSDMAPPWNLTGKQDLFAFLSFDYTYWFYYCIFRNHPSFPSLQLKMLTVSLLPVFRIRSVLVHIRFWSLFWHEKGSVPETIRCEVLYPEYGMEHLSACEFVLPFNDWDTRTAWIERVIPMNVRE